MAAKAAQAAMSIDFSTIDFSSTKLDIKHLQNLMNPKVEPTSKPPGLRPGDEPTKSDKSGTGDFVNMPSENPVCIPGLPAGWKFGDAMPEGVAREPDIPEENKNQHPLDIATSRKKKRRPDQPVIFQVKIEKMS